MRLRHLHLPSPAPGYIPYSLASRVQEHLRRQHLDFKDAAAISPSPSQPPLSPPLPPPPPTLVSFTPSPIYTLGRRQTGPLSPEETARLTAPLHITPSPSPSSSSSSHKHKSYAYTPSIRHAPRGGLLTYHGPGQIVLWPVLDLKSAHHKQFTVRCYARLLENTTIATLDRVFGIRAGVTEDPGVWVTSSAARTRQGTEGGAAAKIAALGVHLRRHVGALGTAVNVDMPVSSPTVRSGQEEEERGNPWARIVACGLEGKGVTSVRGEVGVDGVEAGLKGAGYWDETLEGRERMVAGAWADELARRVGLEGVDVVGAEEAVALMESLVGKGKVEEDVEGDVEEERRYIERMAKVYSA